MNWVAEDFAPLRARIRAEQAEIVRLKKANERTKQHIQQARKFLSEGYKALRMAERLTADPRHNSDADGR
jgi:hypothetical protein